MDCQMPKLDGYATTSRFREWEKEQQRPRTPIVALTANALTGDAEKCFAAGMDRYLSKPFTSEQLFQVLESCAPDNVAADPEPRASDAVLGPTGAGAHPGTAPAGRPEPACQSAWDLFFELARPHRSASYRDRLQ